MCGEKQAYTFQEKYSIGSPPRVRGKASSSSIPSFLQRITPACAGKRLACVDDDVSHGDHPRVCGEKTAPTRYSGSPAGSPPRVRGKGKERLLDVETIRITPACAGKSDNPRVQALLELDHPRVCGEKARCTRAASSTLGSPPRVRGKAASGAVRARACRITPACAGKRKGVDALHITW